MGKKMQMGLKRKMRKARRRPTKRRDKRRQSECLPAADGFHKPHFSDAQMPRSHQLSRVELL